MTTLAYDDRDHHAFIGMITLNLPVQSKNLDADDGAEELFTEATCEVNACDAGAFKQR